MSKLFLDLMSGLTVALNPGSINQLEGEEYRMLRQMFGADVMVEANAGNTQFLNLAPMAIDQLRNRLN